MMAMKWIFVILTWLALAALCEDGFDFETALTLTASAGAIGIVITSDMASKSVDHNNAK